MSLREKFLIGGVIFLVGILVIIGRAALASHDTQLRAETQQQTQKEAFQQAQQSIDQARAAEQKAQDDLQTKLAAIAKQRTVIVTPQQAVQALPQIVPNLPQPLKVEPAPTPENPKAQEIVIPQADLQAFKDYKLDCDASKAEASACALKTQAQKVQLEDKDEQLTIANTERDSWKAAAKGGTTWQRVGSTAKKVGIGIVIGVVTGLAIHH